MRRSISFRLLAGLAILAVAPAIAQTPPASDNPEAANANAPTRITPGANSFAESQARKLLESKGLTSISALVNDNKGIWRGTARRGDDVVQVSVDYQGDVSIK